MLLIRAPSSTNAPLSAGSPRMSFVRAGTSPSDITTNTNIITSSSNNSSNSSRSRSGSVATSNSNGAGAVATRRIPTITEAMDAFVDDVRANRVAAVMSRMNRRTTTPTITAASSSSPPSSTNSVLNGITSPMVDINGSDSNGESALWAATVSLNVSMISVLLQCKADANVLCGPRQSQLPLVVAAASSRMNHTSSSSSLSSSSSSANSNSHIVTVNAMRALLQGGAEVNLSGRDGRTPLHVCHHHDGILLLLRAGADIDARDGDGVTPILAAIRYGAPISHISHLIQLHANINISDDNHTTPLIELMYSNRYSNDISLLLTLLQSMYDRGVRLDHSDIYGRTPLLGAITVYGSSLLVQSLLHHGGASPNYRTLVTGVKIVLTPSLTAIPITSTSNDNNDNDITDSKSSLASLSSEYHMAATAWTHAFATLPLVADMDVIPAHIITSNAIPARVITSSTTSSNVAVSRAVQAGNRCALHIADDIDIVRLLLQAGGDASLRDVAGYTPSDYRHAGDDDSAIIELLTHPPSITHMVDNKANESSLSIGDHVRRGDVHHIRSLLAKHSLLNHVEPSGDTLLGIAIDSGSADMVTLLLESRANVNQINSAGQLPLIRSCRRGDASITSLLLANGANVHAISKASRRTPLHYCADTSITELVARGAAIDAQDIHGLTPLHVMIQQQNWSYVRILLELSASPNIADNNGTTPLLELLYNNGTKSFPADLLQLFITNKAALNVCDKTGRTPLLGAITVTKKVDHIKLLLANGCDANYRTPATGMKKGAVRIGMQTPLFITDELDYIKLLLQYGADATLTDSHGLTAVSYHRNDAIGGVLSHASSLTREKVATSRPLFDAIRHRNTDTIKSLLSHITDTKQTDAGSSSSSSSSSLLLLRVDDINALDVTGDTAVGMAIDHDYDDVLTLLMAAKANANLPNAAGHLPLIRACKRNNGNIIRILLDGGASATLATKQGRTPLHYCQNDTAFQWLVDAKADVNSQDRWGLTPLHMAVDMASVTMMTLLLHARAAPDIGDRFGTTALNQLLNSSSSINVLSAPLLQACVDHGATINIADAKGRSPLLGAIMVSRNIGIISSLLQLKADPNFKTEHTGKLCSASSMLEPVGGQVPLHITNNMDTLMLLLSSNADVHIRGIIYPAYDNNGKTPIEYPRSDEIRYQLRLAGAIGSDGATLLHEAARHGDIALARRLITRGIAINALMTSTGNSALHEAVASGDINMVELLIICGAAIDCANRAGMTPLLVACEHGHDHCVAKLIIYGADVTIYDKHHRSALHIAIMNNELMAARDTYLSIVQLLLEAKHSISVVDEMKRTPLHVAIMTASLPAVELLLESRASVHDIDKMGTTTLHYACRLAKEKVHVHTHIVRLLLKGGVHIDLVDHTGCSALQDAARNGWQVTAEVLIARGADANRAYAGSIYTVMSDPKLSSSMRTTLASIASLSIARMVAEKLKGSIGPSLMRKELAHVCAGTTCRTSFNTMVWKQHCRCCGHIFCKKCLPTRRSIQQWNVVNKRICSACYACLAMNTPSASTALVSLAPTISAAAISLAASLMPSPRVITGGIVSAPIITGGYWVPSGHRSAAANSFNNNNDDDKKARRRAPAGDNDDCDAMRVVVVHGRCQLCDTVNTPLVGHHPCGHTIICHACSIYVKRCHHCTIIICTPSLPPILPSSSLSISTSASLSSSSISPLLSPLSPLIGSSSPPLSPPSLDTALSSSPSSPPLSSLVPSSSSPPLRSRAGAIAVPSTIASLSSSWPLSPRVSAAPLSPSSSPPNSDMATVASSSSSSIARSSSSRAGVGMSLYEINATADSTHDSSLME